MVCAARLCLLVIVTALLLSIPGRAAEPNPKDDVAALLKQLRAAGPQGQGAAEARAAWDKLVSYGPKVLPQLLAAMDTPDTVSSNWLRTAFDAIAERELKAGGKRMPVEPLLQFVKDPKHQGRARRLALDLVEKISPGTSDQLIPGWLDDPEFRFEAVALLMTAADQAAKDNKQEQARAAYEKAFQASRDLNQAKAITKELKKLGVEVDVLTHLGFFRDWYAVGPFDNSRRIGFKTAYPPEEKVDLSAEHMGKSGPVKWKPARIDLEPRTGLVNLLRDVGDFEGAVAYAYTAFETPEPIEVEFRGAADDNLTVFVNGKRVFAFEEYRNGVRLDRHRVKVQLQKGVNTVLLKVCQDAPDPANTERNWEFFLRMVDAKGKGLGFKSALPPK